MVVEKSKNVELQMDELLKKFSPGTSIRTALNDLLSARMGALIVIDKEGLSEVLSGGLKISVKFTPQRLVEFAKMDGAIVLSEDFKKIIRINALLSPDVSISTKETGTRHQAAERVARQIGAVVIAVSEIKNKISIYFKDKKHELEDTSEILRRATETLQVLEKQKEIYQEQISNLNILEINSLVSVRDVCKVLQRVEIIRRISEIVKKYLIELGKEGIIVSMRLKELTKNIAVERKNILNDYFGLKDSKIDSMLQAINFDFLIEISNLQRLLFQETEDKKIISRGMRILKKLNILEKDRELLLAKFKTLDRIFDANEKALLEVFKNKDFVKFLMSNLDNLREEIMAGKS